MTKTFFPVSALLMLMGATTFGAMKISDFANQEPRLDPIKFFYGHTKSSGVLENRGGAPTQRVNTETHGSWENGTLRLEQDLVFSGGKKQHRSWKIRRLDAHHFEATANDMVGVASGEAYGNAFTWTFTLATSPGNPLANVRMTQWMYLQPGGTLINHTTIRKFGIVLAQVTEEFRR